MPVIHCTRCDQSREGVPFKPFPNERGQRVLEQICGSCWDEWLKYQQQLINHYGLNLREQSAKDYLYTQLDQFLFTTGPRS